MESPLEIGTTNTKKTLVSSEGLGQTKNGPERQNRPLILEMNRNDSEGALWSVLRTFEGRSCVCFVPKLSKYQNRP